MLSRRASVSHLCFSVALFAHCLVTINCANRVKSGPLPGVRETLLFRACSQGDIDQVKYLLDQGVNVNAKQQDGETALMFAAVEGKTEVVDLLLQRGADINALSVNDETALVRSVGTSRLESAALLLRRGAEIEKGYPFVYAAGIGDVRMIQSLLDHGANVNASNSAGNSPLHAAISRQVSPEAVRLLLKAGAEVNHRDKKGETPLMIAERNGDKALVDLLIESR